MTPQEKAAELFDKFLNDVNYADAKYNALITVDEILKLPELDNNDMKGWNYWQQVKAEIGKL